MRANRHVKTERGVATVTGGWEIRSRQQRVARCRRGEGNADALNCRRRHTRWQTWCGRSSCSSNNPRDRVRPTSRGAHVNRHPIRSGREVDAHVPAEIDSVEEVCVGIGELQSLQIEGAIVLETMLHLRHLRWQSRFGGCERVSGEQLVE